MIGASAGTHRNFEYASRACRASFTAKAMCLRPSTLGLSDFVGAFTRFLLLKSRQRRSPVARAWIEQVAETIPDEVDRHDGEEQREAGEEHHPGRVPHVVAPVVE